VGKYVLASAFSAAFFYMLPDTTTILSTLAIVAAGSIIYASVLLVIDRDARSTASAIWNEIEGILKKK
jgi:hypothetical protein